MQDNKKLKVGSSPSSAWVMVAQSAAVDAKFLNAGPSDEYLNASAGRGCIQRPRGASLGVNGKFLLVSALLLADSLMGFISQSSANQDDRVSASGEQQQQQQQQHHVSWFVVGDRTANNDLLLRYLQEPNRQN